MKHNQAQAQNTLKNLKLKKKYMEQKKDKLKYKQAHIHFKYQTQTGPKAKMSKWENFPITDNVIQDPDGSERQPYLFLSNYNTHEIKYTLLLVGFQKSALIMDNFTYITWAVKEDFRAQQQKQK